MRQNSRCIDSAAIIPTSVNQRNRLRHPGNHEQVVGAAGHAADGKCVAESCQRDCGDAGAGGAKASARAGARRSRGKPVTFGES